MQTYNQVLTSDGFLNTSEVNTKLFTYNRQSRLSRITFTQQSSKNFRSGFLKIENDIDCLPVILPKDKNILTVNSETFEKSFKKVNDVLEGDWLFQPWISRSDIFPKSSIDLSKYVDNYHDVSNIYLFNNEILEISKILNISSKAVKELLSREAAEYGDHLQALKEYIYNRYGILESCQDNYSSFLNFKKYVLDNHVFKMDRFIEIDSDFIDFITTTLSSTFVNISSNDNNNKYTIKYDLNVIGANYMQSLRRFFTKLKVKFTISENVLEVNNKPLTLFILSCVKKDINFIHGLDLDLSKYFSETLFHTSSISNISLKVALQLKHFLLHHKRVLRIEENALDLYTVSEVFDELSKLDGSCILAEDGYFTRVSCVYQPFEIDSNYIFINTEDNEVMFNNCIVRV